MASADNLMELMFSWIEQRESSAKQLKKLAEELESLKEKCNFSESLGSAVTAVGAVCTIGAGVVTLCTGGAAAPVLGVLGAAYSATGIGVTVVTKITEHFLSSDTMKEAVKTEKKSNDIAEKIQKLFQQLTLERTDVTFTDSRELAQQTMMDFMEVMAREKGLEDRDWKIHSQMHGDRQRFVFFEGTRRHREIFLQFPVMLGFAFLLESQLQKMKSGKLLTLLGEGGGVLIKQTPGACFEQLSSSVSQKAGHVTKAISKIGVKRALIGGTMVLGGTVGLVFALSELNEKVTDMINNNNVTGASKSLRETADAILRISRTMRKELNNVKTMFEEMKRRQQEDEESDQEESDQEEFPRDSDQEEFPHDSDQEEEENYSEEEESDSEEEERDSEEEESDSEEEESDSEEETEDDENEQSGQKKKRHRKKSKKEEINVDKHQENQHQRSGHEFMTNRSPPASFRVGLLNVRSINKDPSRIKELITENMLDVFLSTETWLKKETGDAVLTEASPQHFNFNHRTRDGRGGGVAIQSSEALHGEQIPFCNTETFEYVATAVRHDEWDEDVLIINVYRRPGYTLRRLGEFLDEFQDLLNEVSESYSSIMITGDFNIWVDEERRRSSTEFDFFLLINDLTQHVDEPTHRAGHSLDLVITRNVEISDLSVRNDGVSDHYSVYFTARPVSRDAKEKPEEQDELVKRCKRKEE